MQIALSIKNLCNIIIDKAYLSLRSQKSEIIMKNKKISTYLLIGLLSAGSIFSFGFADQYFEIAKNLDIFSTLYRELNYNYVDDIDPSKLMRTGIDAMLKSLDPFTNFISESEIEDYRFQTTGKYGGIGALIKSNGEYVIIAEPYEGFPAYKAGLVAGDIILEIDGNSAKGKTTTEISQILRGEPGSEVKLLIKRPYKEEEEIKTLLREEIKVESVPYYGMINDNTGYITLSSFTDKAGKEVKDALVKLQQENPSMSGLVFDLRNNPGGLLNEAINVSNVFIPKGKEIVSTKGKVPGMDKTYRTLNEATDITIPLVVLVNSGSASASEIVSGTVQDLDRGIVLGRKTYGKGLVQTTKVLSYGTQLKVTTAKYYTPSGRCIQAIDYSNRNEDGSVGKLPDSLKTAFKTVNGRLVYDGGGIDPDITVEQERYALITASLVGNELIFDYATLYKSKHPTIPPAKEFKLSNEDYNDFVAFLSDKEYDYKTESEDLLEQLQESSKEEKYYDAIEQELLDLKTDIKHNKDKDLYTFKDEITEILELEIASRYYYQTGRIEASFNNDKDIQRALEVLQNSKEYASIIQRPVIGE